MDTSTTTPATGASSASSRSGPVPLAPWPTTSAHQLPKMSSRPASTSTSMLAPNDIALADSQPQPGFSPPAQVGGYQAFGFPVFTAPRSRFCAAVHGGDATAVKRMIQSGMGDLNTLDAATGMTALMLAAHRGHEDVVLLLCKGASAGDIHRPGPLDESALMMAAAAGHTDAMEVLLHKAATQQHKDEALAWAAANGQVASIELLLVHGARAAQPDALGTTPLHKAAGQGHVAAIDALLEAGADPAAIDSLGNSAFSLAVCEGQIEAVRRLLQAMASLPGQTGHSALMLAAAGGHTDAVALLLAHGDDLHAVTSEGDTALLLAARQGHTAIVKLLARKSDVNHANQQGDTALILATRGGHFDIAQRLLVKGAQAATCNLNRESALSAADKAGHGRLVQLLTLMNASATADIMPLSSAQAMSGSALMQAADFGDLAKAQALLAAGTDVNQADDGGWTPLFNAACQGHVALMKLLLSRGAAIDHVNRNGETALMLAAGAGQFAAAQVLLDAGADAMLCNHEGKTASRMATNIGHELLAFAMDGIVARAGSVSTTSSTNISTTSCTTASIQPSSTNASSSAPGMTVAVPMPVFSTRPATWQEAVERNDIEGLKELLVAEERLQGQLRQPLQKRRKKSTMIYLPPTPMPLHFAASKGYTAAVKALLTAGADPNATKLISRVTALMEAASAGHTAVVRALLLVDANVKRKDANGSTALSRARAKNHGEIVKLLRAQGATD